MIYILTVSLIYAVCAYVWVCILTEGGNLFDFVPKWYYSRVGTDYPKIENVLFACSKCFGGQLALWTYPFVASNYRASEHLLITILTIFFAKILESKI